jgi:hypothetical protein
LAPSEAAITLFISALRATEKVLGSQCLAHRLRGLCVNGHGQLFKEHVRFGVGGGSSTQPRGRKAACRRGRNPHLRIDQRSAGYGSAFPGFRCLRFATRPGRAGINVVSMWTRKMGVVYPDGKTE